MIVRRLLLLGGLAYGLPLLGLATLNGELLTLALPLVVYLLAALLYGPGELQLEVSRTLNADRVSHGTLVGVELSIINEGAGLEQVLIEDLVPPPLELADGESRVLASLPPGETIKLELYIQDLSTDWCNMYDHQTWAYAKDFVFMSP